ncbi:MAG: acyl-CoA thioesterase [Gemmatimonadaceae bacterium]|nr:acyl-CoA thioesterase [Gemmatimonadaceae bacterium]
MTETRVRYAETDQMGVAYHANYLVWCEMGRTDFIREHFKSYADVERDGVRLAVADAQVRYLAPARYDEIIRIETRLADVRSRAVAFEYTITRPADDVRLATARTVLVSVDGAQRPVAMPAELRGRLAAASE